MDTKEKNGKKFCQCFTQGNAFRVRDSKNKRASAPPRAGTYFGNAQLQGHYYPRHKSLGTNWVFYGRFLTENDPMAQVTFIPMWLNYSQPHHTW